MTGGGRGVAGDYLVRYRYSSRVFRPKIVQRVNSYRHFDRRPYTQNGQVISIERLVSCLIVITRFPSRTLELHSMRVSKLSPD